MPDKKSFTQVDAVQEVVQQLKKADLTRAENRALIAQLFNGEPPWTEQEAKDNNAETNVNFLEGTKIALDARSQFNNAFLKPANFFTVEIDLPDSTKALQFGKIVTKYINRALKRSLPYMETLRAQFASVVLHGIGPVVWPNRDSWIPDPFAVGDVLIPDRTRIDMRNLGYFTIRREWTPYELLDMTSGDHVAPRWNKPVVRALLAELIENKYKAAGTNTGINFNERPEEVAELMKENSMFWGSSAVPTIVCWDFYYQDCEDEAGGWKRCIVLDQGNDTKIKADQFLYKPGKAYESEWSRIIHWQFGDAANSAPFRYHSIRSLGWLLYSVLQLQNRLRCKWSDAVFENMLMYFRVANPTDLDRIQRVDLHHLGIWPEGLNAVKQEERHTPEFNLVNTLIQQNRQLMAESASSYVQNVDDGRSKEMTASEVVARQNAANAIVSSMLNLAFTYQAFQYSEICRRFLNRKSRDADVKKFWDAMQREQVPPAALDFERWTVTPERVLGAGNKTIEMHEAQQLMAVRPMLDPDSQRIVVHKFVLANSDDARLADRLVPLDKQLLPSETVVEAQQTAGVLLMGLPVGMRSGVNRGEYIGALIQSLTVAVGKIQQRGGVPQSPDELQGLQNLATHIGQNLQLFAQDTQQKQIVQALAAKLTQLNNFIRGFAQRLAKAMQQQQEQNGNGRPDPKTMADIQNKNMLAEQKRQERAANFSQKMQQRQVEFSNDQQRKNAAAHHESMRDYHQHQLDMAIQDAASAMDIHRQAKELEAAGTPEESPSEPQTQTA